MPENLQILMRLSAQENFIAYMILSNMIILCNYTVHIVIQKFRKSSTSVSYQETVNNLKILKDNLIKSKTNIGHATELKFLKAQQLKICSDVAKSFMTQYIRGRYYLSA